MKSSSACRTWAFRARKRALSGARNKATSRLELAWGATQDHGPRAWAGPETVNRPGLSELSHCPACAARAASDGARGRYHRKAQASRLAAAGSPTTSIVAEEDPGLNEAGSERLAGAFLPFSGMARVRQVLFSRKSRGSVDCPDQNIGVFKYRDPAPGMRGRLPF